MRLKDWRKQLKGFFGITDKGNLKEFQKERKMQLQNMDLMVWISGGGGGGEGERKENVPEDSNKKNARTALRMTEIAPVCYFYL